MFFTFITNFFIAIFPSFLLGVLFGIIIRPFYTRRKNINVLPLTK